MTDSTHNEYPEISEADCANMQQILAEIEALALVNRTQRGVYFGSDELAKTPTGSELMTALQEARGSLQEVESLVRGMQPDAYKNSAGYQSAVKDFNEKLFTTQQASSRLADEDKTRREAMKAGVKLFTQQLSQALVDGIRSSPSYQRIVNPAFTNGSGARYDFRPYSVSSSGPSYGTPYSSNDRYRQYEPYSPDEVVYPRQRGYQTTQPNMGNPSSMSGQPAYSASEHWYGFGATRDSYSEFGQYEYDSQDNGGNSRQRGYQGSRRGQGQDDNGSYDGYYD